MRKTTLILIVAMVSCPTLAAYATTQLGWADEFSSAFANCANTTCSVGGWYDTTAGTTEPLTWSYVGKQGANSTGRANARERVAFSFRDDTTSGCSTQTVQIARYRSTTIPTEGTNCPSSITFTFVGSTSTTVDSCQFPNSDELYWNRNLPVFDFSLETATGNVAYKSIVTRTDSLGGTNTTTQCFKILWQ
jgi:hypothetical protein